MTIDTAFILAAGRGSRLGSLTEHCPKPLIPIAGQPIIERLLRQLVHAGIRHVVMNVSYLKEMMVEQLKDGREFGCTIEYSIEETPLETAGGIIAALDRLPEHFLVVNADLVTEYPFKQLLNKETFSNEGHLVLVPTPATKGRGDYGLEEGRCTLSEANHLTFSGISLLSRAFFDGFPPQKRCLSDVFRKKIEQRGLTGELYSGMWHDVGTLECFEFAQKQLKGSIA